MFQALAGAAAAATPGASAHPLPAPASTASTPASPSASPRDPALEAALAPQVAEVAASSPSDVIRQVSRIQGPSYPISPEEALGTAAGPTPLADTDNNTINQARQMNGASQWTGESVEGRDIGFGRRADVDWWWFPMGNVSAGTADVFEFDVQKEAGEYLFVNVYTFASFDPANYMGAPGSPNLHTVFYDTMNTTQGWGANTHVKVTAFEAANYYLYLASPRRNGCCMVNYSLLNLTDYTATSDPTIDDNSNRTSADVFNAGAMPTNQEVEQNGDYVDVFDLTAQFAITPANGDYSYVTLNVSLVAGRNGISDFWNTTQTPAVTSEGDTLSYATLWVFYPDPRGIWHTISTSGVPGDTLRYAGLINGTPLYAAISVASLVNIPGFYPASSVPGWVRYNFTGFSHVDDRAPDFVPQIPGALMWEDNATSGQNLVDLAPWFTDDRDNGALWFSLKYNQFPLNASLTIAGNFLSVATSANWWGNVTIQVLAHDAGMDRIFHTPDDHATSSNFFIVNVQPVNDPPSITAIGGLANLGSELAFSVNQDATLALTPTVADIDGLTGFTFSLAPIPSFATFYAGNGTITFQPKNADVGVVHLVETVDDGGGGTATVALSIAVLNVNDKPHFVAVGGVLVSQFPHTFQAMQGALFRISLQVDDADWDIGVRNNIQFAADRSYFTAEAPAADLRFANFSFTPTNAQVGGLTVTFSVTDGVTGGFDDNVTVSISVQNANDPPFFVSVSKSDTYPVPASHWVNITGFDGGHQGALFTVTVRADDIDVSGGHGDVLTFSTSLPGQFTVVNNPDGYTADVSFRPNQTDATRGYVVVDIIVTDAGAVPLSDTVHMWISVEDRPDPPVWTPVFSINITQGVEFAQTFQALDPDGDRVSYSSDSPLISIDQTTGVVDLTLTNDLIGGQDMQFDVTFTARDTTNRFTTMSVHVFVRNVNDAPTAAIQLPEDGSTWGPADLVNFAAQGSDPDAGDAAGLTYTWYVDGTEKASGKTAVFAIGNPGASERSAEVRLQVSDAHGASVNKTVSVKVSGAAAPPKSPGFEALGALVAIAAAGGLGAISLRRRK
jgi:hypothetical protein